MEQIIDLDHFFVAVNMHSPSPMSTFPSVFFRPFRRNGATFARRRNEVMALHFHVNQRNPVFVSFRRPV
jgi:hypothetical protein